MAIDVGDWLAPTPAAGPTPHAGLMLVDGRSVPLKAREVRATLHTAAGFSDTCESFNYVSDVEAGCSVQFKFPLPPRSAIYRYGQGAGEELPGSCHGALCARGMKQPQQHRHQHAAWPWVAVAPAARASTHARTRGTCHTAAPAPAAARRFEAVIGDRTVRTEVGGCTCVHSVCACPAGTGCLQADNAAPCHLRP